MTANISYYRTKGQIKAFPKFNSKIVAFGTTKHKALDALRNNPSFIIWCQDQYMTGEISKEYLADMLGIVHQSIDQYISQKKLIIKELVVAKRKVRDFNPNMTQIAVLRMLQRGGHLKQYEEGDLYLVNAMGESIPVVTERKVSVQELITKSYIRKDKNTTEKIPNSVSGEKPHILKIAIYVITNKGIVSLVHIDMKDKVQLEL